MNYKEVIWKELRIWQRAYPEEAELLKRFAMKLKLEIQLQTDLDAQTNYVDNDEAFLRECKRFGVNIYPKNETPSDKTSKDMSDTILDGQTENKVVDMTAQQDKPRENVHLDLCKEHNYPVNENGFCDFGKHFPINIRKSKVKSK